MADAPVHLEDELGVAAKRSAQQAHGLVADELRRADRLVNRRGWGAGEAQLVRKDERPALRS
jgi:hypothetical protein